MQDRIRIGEGLVVGRRAPGTAELARLGAEGVRGVVDLRLAEETAGGLSPAQEAEEARRLGLAYRHLPVPKDGPDAAALERFAGTLAELPAPVLVHCDDGVRAATLGIAHRARREGLRMEEALARSLGGRPRAGVPQTRVSRHTDAEINRRIALEIERSVHFHAARPELIGERLRQLDAEWDIERVLETNAASLALAGTLLGILVRRSYLALPVAVTGFLLQHALQGWCPPIPLFRRMGVRTAEEIARERMALKALRGDFDPLRQAPAEDARARGEAALRAAAA
ncbi:beta-lactamase hydrolase domain-containing protein [Crenalkalicoccus roseus]|uniref:beta-lactamase hydrolase domain-containing protein n=1 Tax=Crenalkalicoccus roseus TaxID=1485588 RepID=UPI0010808A4B|nr:sulfur transferase domain-containing protein [Crenalkalicoccus roseus]